jgi:hypothetical protein
MKSRDKSFPGIAMLVLALALVVGVAFGQT